MSLSPGTRLGPYEILSPLGAGGMGEVYRGRDTRLGREVAVKVLPAALASDPGRLKRFEREARAASALNHPSIVTIYEIGAADTVPYIAMELVKGEPLRSVLRQGAVPVRRLLQIGTELAEGLAKAHAAGIVHRDLKPENVMLTEDGHVKILDFGLAKLTQPDAGSSGETEAQTVSEPTGVGVVLGTAGYMSPEQAAGAPADHRSDQFSFGVILYEMATGRRAFVRASQPETLTAIIREEPEPISTGDPGIPTLLRWSVERCLSKEPKRRYASTEDLARDLTTLRDRLSEVTSGAPAAPSLTEPTRRRRIAALFVAALVVSLGTVGWWLRQRDAFWTNPLAGARFTRFTDWEGSEEDAAISSDGKFVVFRSDRSGPFDAWVGQVGGGAFLDLSKGRAEGSIFATRGVGFSGDGALVWFPVMPEKWAPMQIWVVPTLGGMPRIFLPKGMETAWSPDGSRIAYYYPPGDAIFVADRNGGNPQQILADKPGIHNHYLTWSPDGRFLYFVRGLRPDDMDVWRIRLTGGEPERLTNHRSRVAYPALLDPQTLIYSATRADGGSGLFAMDVDRRIPHAVTSGLEDYTSVSASADGRRLAATVANPVRNLWTVPVADHVVDESGLARFDLPTVRAEAPRYGPDFVLYLSSRGGANGLWKLQNGSETELWSGRDGPVSFAPAVSPDGAQIAFVVEVEGRHRLSLMASDGTNTHRIAESLDVVDVPSWSPDGRWIAVVGRDDDGKKRPLYKVPVDGGSPVRLVEGIKSDPVWSPDGRLILYSEGPAGAVWLRAATPEGKPWPVPNVSVPFGGNRYRFLPGGKAVVIVLSSLGEKLVPQDFFLLELATGATRQLTKLRPGSIMKSFDVSREGKEILFDRYRENSDIVLIDRAPR